MRGYGMSEAVTLFREYMGKGFVMILFFIALIYLFVSEKNKNRRILFVYMPVTVLVIFFNPFSTGLLMRILDSEIYYRLLWLLPMTAVLSYTVSQIYIKLQGASRALFLAGAAAIIMISGSFIYMNPNYSRAENLYHIPDEVIEICDALEAEDPEHESYVAVPSEMLQYVRQYSGKLVLEYGREVLVDRWENYNELYEAMEADPMDAATIKREMRKFAVLPKDKAGLENFTEMVQVYESEHYVVYVHKYWKNYDGKFPYTENPDYQWW